MHAAPFIGWVDYSPKERDRMRQALALFKENDTRDELGLGSIRDALADLLFPGTSTIQTRLRYFLFVPWIYQELDRRKVAPDKLDGVTHSRLTTLDDDDRVDEPTPQATPVVDVLDSRI